MTSGPSLIAVVAPVLAALRARWRAALLIVALGALAILYGSVLAPALSATVGQRFLADPGSLLRAGILPVMLAVLVGTLPGLAVTRRQPGPLLH
jgi:hypothetical protein